MYRAPSGALVFGAGTVQWAWGLDTTNAWADNGAAGGRRARPGHAAGDGQPVRRHGRCSRRRCMSGLHAGDAVDRHDARPTSTITSPAAGAAIADGTRVTISGTATDTRRRGGRRRGLDRRRHDLAPGDRARPRGPTAGSPTARRRTTITARAPSTTAATSRPRRRASASTSAARARMAGPERDAATSSTRATPTRSSVGVRFKADLDGTITGVRFYKAAANTGTHIGNLWTAERHAARRAGRSPARARTGWQQLTFATPVEHHRRARPTSRPTSRRTGTTRRRRRTSSRRARPAATRSTARRCTRISANGGVRQRRLRLRERRRRSRPPRSTARTTRSTSSSRRSCRRARSSSVTATAGPGSATVNFLAPVDRRLAHALHRHAVHRLGRADRR